MGNNYKEELQIFVRYEKLKAFGKPSTGNERSSKPSEHNS